MSTNSSKKTRKDRVADLNPTLRMPARLWGYLQRSDVLLRLGLCLGAALIMLLATFGWYPPQPYRIGQTPSRAIVARTDFKIYSATKTNERRLEKKSLAPGVYVHRAEPLVQLQAQLQGQIARLISDNEKVYDEEVDKLWEEFYFVSETSPLPDKASREEHLGQFREHLSGEGEFAKFEAAIATSLSDIEHNGLLEVLSDPIENNKETDQYNHAEVLVYEAGKTDDAPKTREVKSVLIVHVLPEIKKSLKAEIGFDDVVQRIDDWLKKKLPGAVTLEFDKDRTEVLRRNVIAAVEDQTDTIRKNDVIVQAETTIDVEAIAKLNAEYETYLATLPTSVMTGRALATLGMFLAMYTLSGFFIMFRYPSILSRIGEFTGILVLSLLTVVLCYIADYWNAEMIPLLLFAMTVAIAFNRELALLLSAAVGLVVVLSLGQNLSAFVILMAATATSVLLLGRVRSRTKLTYVGCCVGCVATLTTIGVSLVDPQSFGVNWKDAGYFGIWGIASGFLMTALLPFIESIFGVITDISLLELGDVAHPLLQELVRRAPGTYNHSINVASMAESAAESIGAQGLLVRVGAYFHDVGKMLKPQYFIENQSADDNRHESLVPAMSTLIIIAHVKDGADLARQHHLPRPIIDFIMQHHGTTLVEYFYRRASEKSEENPDAEQVDEHTFRYPGPKPQTREAGILMLADAVESASRTLVEPTPARIESLIDEICMKRLLDGQLDECGLTLQEVRAIQDSLVKSLIAVYHGRVKYPDQQTA